MEGRNGPDELGRDIGIVSFGCCPGMRGNAGGKTGYIRVR